MGEKNRYVLFAAGRPHGGLSRGTPGVLELHTKRWRGFELPRHLLRAVTWIFYKAEVSFVSTTSETQTSHTMASEAVFVLPGDRIDPSLIPSHPKKPLRLGPGLRHVPPNDIVPTLAGQLITDRPKNAIRVENSGGRVRFFSPTKLPTSV